MLQIFPIQDKQEQEQACLRCQIAYDADYMAYEATVEEELVGICQFTLRADGGSIRDLAPVIGKEPDGEALFLMARAALNFIDLCGVHQAFFDGNTAPAGETLIHAIGFRRPQGDPTGRLSMDLTDFFTAPCRHS